MSLSPSHAQRVAARALAGLASAGVSHFLIAPGARSQSLALAAEQLEQAGLAKVVVRLDERSLAFTALGLGLASKRAAVITTSGTAVANLHPAVLEAHHAGVPLLLITADRPAALRGTGANQTTLQPGIFADATRATFDLSADAALKDETVDELVAEAMAQALGHYPDGQPGPVQLNIQFHEPLSALEPNAAEVARALSQASTTREQPELEPAILPWVERTVVLAGAGAGASANEFAVRGGYPLFAEPSSGARFGPQLVTRYADLAESEPANQIERIIVFGKPTLHRKVLALLARPQVELVVVHDRHHGYFNPTGRTSNHLNAVIAEPAPVGNDGAQWLAAWHSTERNLAGPVDAVERNRVELVRAVFEAGNSDPDSSLLLGASELIRVADRFAPAGHVSCFANRGLAGIDGTVSTAIGLALAKPESQIRVLLGDLTLLHDAGSLNLSGLGPGGRPGSPSLQLIVGNDAGGRIFEHLPIASVAGAAQFERLFLTPQQVDLAALAQAYGWRYFKTNAQSVGAFLAERGPVLIDVSL